MKTNKSYTKRIKVTKNDELLVQKRGGNHFNAKEPRKKQLKRHSLKKFAMSQRDRRRFLPGKSGR